MKNLSQNKKNESVLLVINGKKLVTGDEAKIIESISDRLPEEALQIIKTINKYNSISNMFGNSKVASTSTGLNMEGLPNTISIDELNLIQNKNSIEKKVSDHSLQNENSAKIIIENTGAFNEIVIGKTNRQGVIEIMTKYSKFNFSAMDNNLSYYFLDISILISFDKNGIVEEITYEQGYKGQPVKGLKIGDSIEKAIKLLGQPKMRSIRGAIWDKLAVFIKEDVITSIRLQ